MSERRGTGPMSKNTVMLNDVKLLTAIKKSGITMTKLSVMVLGRGNTYISEALRDKRCNKEDLMKLCSFLDLNYDDVVITEIPKIEVEKTPSEVINLDALILGVNQLYQIEKANNELMTQMLEQMKVTNAKLARMENITGQTHANVIQIKDSIKESISVQREEKSSVATMSGRLKDIHSYFTNNMGVVKR